MQQKRLNKNQRKVQKELEKKVYAAKADAKSLSRGIPHKHIKIATRKLTELYDTVEFRNNHKFLLKRYANLEKREKMWNNLFLPVILSLLMSETLITKIKSVFCFRNDLYNKRNYDAQRNSSDNADVGTGSFLDSIRGLSASCFSFSFPFRALPGYVIQVFFS